MKQPGDSPFSSDAEMEVELTTQDLVGLTPAYPVDAPSITPVETATLIAVAAPNANAAPSSASRTRMRWMAPKAVGLVATVTVSLIAIVSLAELAPPQRVVERPVSDWSPVPDPIVVDEAMEATSPTLFANPFDPSEVFELPPGLSRDQARDMVADLLLKRASERRVYAGNRR